MRIFILLFFLSGMASFAQDINGIVLDKETKEPVEGVHVTSPYLLKNTFTDSNGEYSGTLRKAASSRDSIYFTSIGYKGRAISLKALKEMNFLVSLEAASEELREVNLHTRKVMNRKIRFKELASMNTGVYDYGSVVVGNKIYVVAGNGSFYEDPIKEEVSRSMGKIDLRRIMQASRKNFSWNTHSDKVQIYDLEKDLWETSPLEVRRRASHNVSLHDDKIYVFGGKNLQKAKKKEFLDDKIEVIDLLKDTILTDHTNPHQAVASAAVTHNGNLLVMGGSTRVNKIGKKSFSDEVHLYNYESGEWFLAGKMSSAKETRGVLADQKIYLVGGYDNRPVDTIESLDLSTGKWMQEATLFRKIEAPAIAVNNGIIYIYDKGEFYTYDTRSRELTLFSIDLQVQGANLHVWEDRLYLMGGYRKDEFSKEPRTECYSIDLEEFKTTKILGRHSFNDSGNS